MPLSYWWLNTRFCLSAVVLALSAVQDFQHSFGSDFMVKAVWASHFGIAGCMNVLWRCTAVLVTLDLPTVCLVNGSAFTLTVSVCRDRLQVDNYYKSSSLASLVNSSAFTLTVCVCRDRLQVYNYYKSSGLASLVNISAFTLTVGVCWDSLQVGNYDKSSSLTMSPKGSREWKW